MPTKDSITFDQRSLDLLKASYEQLLRGRTGLEAQAVLERVSDHWKGVPPSEWVINMFKGKSIPSGIDDMPQNAMARSDLRRFLLETDEPDRQLCAILAWGGTGYQSRDSLSSTWELWVRQFQDHRGKAANKQYKSYQYEKKNKNIKGLGPAFITKAIFFSSPTESAGYIMDQWTARSANALTNNSNFVKLNKRPVETKSDGFQRPAGFIVSDTNNDNTYTNFNRLVEAVGTELGCSAEHAELLMFTRATFWRNYIALRDNEDLPQV